MPKATRPTKPRRFIRQALIIGAFAMAGLAGAVSGVLFAYSPDLPEISELDRYTPGTITRLYARGGELIGEFATERRLILGYDEIPEVLRNAIISAEDGDFFTHVGINIPRIIITMVSNVLKGDLTDAGASTITMQLARNVRLGGERLGLQKTWQRKLLEAYYAFHIEKRYTKREILTLYANQMWLGTVTHSAYGVEAASRLYFGKSAQDLDLGEAALIAGIFQSPARQSPLVSLDLARSRRNYERHARRDVANERQGVPVATSSDDGRQPQTRPDLNRREHPRRPGLPSRERADLVGLQLGGDEAGGPAAVKSATH